MIVTAAPPAAPSIPDLRQELRIEPGAPLVTGAPSWTLFDPIRHIFFQIGKIEQIVFARWASGSFAGVVDDLRREGLDAQEADAAVGQVLEFSITNQLTLAPMQNTVGTFTAQRAAQKKAVWKWMLDNYLFFRLPLVKPGAFLERTLPIVAPLWSPKALWFFAGLAILGLYLVSRQWDTFLSSFQYFFSWNGLFAYALGMSAVKVIHELGHAYTATRFGCRVPTMGVSFLVMFPVLYTDTTGAWRLRSRRQRLAIDCAGVTAELMVATLSTLIWVILPDGALRSVFFVLATSSWVLSLAVNLNPFMRFDGYYVLSDLLAVPNLQSRAFALGRWRMRELLFGLGNEPPEQVPVNMRRLMTVYAWFTWVYRLILFVGIALLVYFMFFKLLGIILFLVEIGVFVLRPLVAEFKIWSERRNEIMASNRGKLLAGSVMVGLLLAVLPLDRHIDAPAILSPMDASAIVAGDPARIERLLVTNGQSVKAGDIIAELSAPEVNAVLDQNKLRIAQLQSQLARIAAGGLDLTNRAVLERELAAEQSAAGGARKRQNRLVLRSPSDGVVVDLGSDMHVGRWLNGAEEITRIVTPGRNDIRAFVAEDDFWRLMPGAKAKFVPDDLSFASRQAKLVERSTAALQFLDEALLASTSGGPVAVTEDAQKRLKPRKALYRARFLAALENPDGKPESSGIIQPQKGRLVIEAAGTSIAMQFFRTLTQTVRRESSLN